MPILAIDSGVRWIEKSLAKAPMPHQDGVELVSLW